MKSITLSSPKWTVILRPCTAKRFGQMDAVLREIVAIWLYEGKSTGDAIARDDFWSLVNQSLALLQIEPKEGTPSTAAIIEYLQSDPERLEQLFISQNYELQGYKADNQPRDIEVFDPSELIELHRFEPKKKLIEAYRLYLSMTKASQIEPLSPTTSPSTPAETPQ